MDALNVIYKTLLDRKQYYKLNRTELFILNVVRKALKDAGNATADH